MTPNLRILEPSSLGILAVLSFVIGYREATVRELITKVVDTIFTPAGGKSADVDYSDEVSINPSPLDFGSLGVSKFTIRVLNLINGGEAAVEINEIVEPGPAFRGLESGLAQRCIHPASEEATSRSEIHTG